MKILYASTFIDNQYFEQIYNNSKEKPIQSIQRFNKLINEGFNDNKNVDSITILTAPPINRKISKQFFWKYKTVTENKTTFVYLPFINIKIIKQICLFFSALIFMIIWSLKTSKKDSNIIYDGFFPIISTISAFIGKTFGIKVTGMYTDLPKFMNHNSKKQSFYKKLIKMVAGIGDNISIRLCDSFIFLTEHMNSLINKENKPYIIMEGIVDKDTTPIIKNSKESKKIFMYAGGLYEQYGLKTFIEAFKMSDNKAELWIFGSGELESYIKSVKSDSIKFFGSKPNKEILEYEKKASILVNPRFSNEEYTKYSFPSKNLEYMASGTPLLTTKLPGIPEEYNKYVYFFDKEDVNGYCEKINELVSLDNEVLIKKGYEAQQFVCSEKNNVKQTNKIIKLFDKKNNSKIMHNESSKILNFYLIFLEICIILFSRNTLYSSLLIGQRLSTLMITMLSIPALLMYYQKIKKKENNLLNDIWFSIFVFLIIFSILIKCDFTLINLTIVSSIVIGYVTANLINKKTFIKVFIYLILLFSILSLVNLYAIKPLIISNGLFSSLRSTSLYFQTSAGTPMINFITSFILYEPNYIRNFSFFNEPAYFQFYILIAMIFIYYYKFSTKLKIMYLLLLFITLISTFSTSGFISFFIIAIVFMKKINAKERKKYYFGILVILLLIILSAALDSNIFMNLNKSLTKIFTPNESIDTRAGGIFQSIDIFIRNPLFGIQTNKYFSLGIISNTLPSLVNIFGFLPGIFLTVYTYNFTKRIEKTFLLYILLFIGLMISSNLHIFIYVCSYWLIIFSLSIEEVKNENTLDS